MKMLTAVQEMVIRTCTNPQIIVVHVASRRAAQVTYLLASEYHEGSVYDLDPLREAASGERRLPKSFNVTVSPCYDFSEVLREFELAAESIEDGFSTELPHPPVLSDDMCLKLLSPDERRVGDALIRAAQHGYFLGLSDASHWVQDDVAFAPYAGHTPKETVGILKSFYVEAKGDESAFMQRIMNSEDPRIHRTSRMAIEVFFHLLSLSV